MQNLENNGPNRRAGTTKHTKVCWFLVTKSGILLPRHFPGPAFSSPAIWSVIFQVVHFPAMRFGPSFSRSCIFQPCDLVRHFPGPALDRSCIFSRPQHCTSKMLTFSASLECVVIDMEISINIYIRNSTDYRYCIKPTTNHNK